MANVESILRRKGREVVTARPDMTVLEAARIMNGRRIGCVVVTDEGDPHRLVGILTERDILTRLVGGERDPTRTSVRELMTATVTTCAPGTAVSELRELMRQQRIRHVPVCDGDGLCGLVSIGDVNALETDGLSQALTAMEEYITRG